MKPLHNLFLLAGLITSCGRPMVHVGDPGSGSGPLHEVELNDQPWDTQVFDSLEVFQILDLVGVVDAAPGFDLTDHLGFVAAGPMEVFVTLEGDFEALDLDLAVWDPTTSSYAAAWETSGFVETAVFAVDSAGPFQLAVYSPFTSGNWFLRVEGFPLPGYSPGVNESPGPRIRRTQAERPENSPAPDRIAP
jgi:hypothetical protein